MLNDFLGFEEISLVPFFFLIPSLLMNSDIYLFHNLLPYVMLNNFLGFEEIIVVTIFFIFNSIFVNNLSFSS